VKDMKGVRVSFNKADLEHLDDGELKIVCVFPHVLNRLRVLESQVFGHMNVALDESQEGTKREIAICGFIESIILVAGELKEGWEAIQQCYYETKVSKAMNSTLPPTIQTALKRLPGHFSGESLAMFLRNNFAYHNSPETAVQALKTFSDDATLTFTVLEQEHFHFDFATHVRIGAIAEWLRIDDWVEVIHPLMETIMGRVFNDVCLPMIVIANTILLTVKNTRTPIQVTAVPSDAELRSEALSYMSSEHSQPDSQDKASVPSSQ